MVPSLAMRLDQDIEERLVMFTSLQSAIEAHHYSSRRSLGKTPTCWIPRNGHNLSVPHDGYSPIRSQKDILNKGDHDCLVAVSIFVQDMHAAKCQQLPQGGAAYVFNKIKIDNLQVQFYHLELHVNLDVDSDSVTADDRVAGPCLAVENVRDQHDGQADDDVPVPETGSKPTLKRKRHLELEDDGGKPQPDDAEELAEPTVDKFMAVSNSLHNIIKGRLNSQGAVLITVSDFNIRVHEEASITQAIYDGMSERFMPTYDSPATALLHFGLLKKASAVSVKDELTMGGSSWHEADDNSVGAGAGSVLAEAESKQTVALLKITFGQTTWQAMLDAGQAVPNSVPFRHWRILCDMPNTDGFRKSIRFYKASFANKLTSVTNLKDSSLAHLVVN
ncbi:unnamed protein product [Symbiodinium sp. CCMP2592]|nr:unnamed protein product [Symbiodinium sp. CCMP2592]CAE7837851.1 unnamed protein product [Symbiodinium sp. CCMP2592]